MISFMKKVLVFLLIIVVISFLFTDNNETSINTSVNEVIDIIDKDNIVKDEEIKIEDEGVVENTNNIFVDLIYFVSSIIINIFEFISSFISSVLSSYVSY